MVSEITRNHVPEWLEKLAGDYEKEVLSAKRLVVSNTHPDYPGNIVVWDKDTNKGFVHDVVLPVSKRQILAHIDMSELILEDNRKIAPGPKL